MSIRQEIVAQFKQPHGYIGQLAGFIMARRSSNIERNDWTLALLNLAPGDKVLEVGFGPGIAIAMAARVVYPGLIVGVDHSETMLHQARKRNAMAIQEGRVQLHLGTVDTLPPSYNYFDKIYTSNVVQFWQNVEREFAQLYDRLSPGGEVATTYMPRHRGATHAAARQKAHEIVGALQAVGFRHIQVKERRFPSASAICVLAEK